ncbi:MAG: hypothetical protein LLG13_17780 [Bacteroidales bacterium]|nr:hypothetical protein [Bacteroidales bacterium]
MQRKIYRNTIIILFVFLATIFNLTALESSSKVCSNNSIPVKKQELKAAARTFSVTAKIGQETSGQTGSKIGKIYGDLKSTIVLLEYGDTKLCFLTSPLGVEGGLNSASRVLIAKELGLDKTQVVAACSHDHTVPSVSVRNPEAWGLPGDFPPKSESNEISRDFLEGLASASKGLDKELVPVTVEWGITHEDRLTYNRRGKREDGTSYFIREEDRLELGEGYIGKIDPDAMVVILRSKKGNPVTALTFYTGHPVSGYNPEEMVSFGQWPQVASEKLSAYLGGIPVAFFQGCCGDINSKYMLTGTIEQSRQLGEYLGDSFIAAAKNLHRSQRTDLKWARKNVNIPFAELPDPSSLKLDLASINDFISRGNAGDENTMKCVGMNFPKALTPPYRARLVAMVRPWYEWAIEQYRTGKAAEVPKYFPIEIVVAQFGDVGFVGMPFEAFVRTGLKIKEEAPLPCVFTSGYTDGGNGYIPDASACNDREYMAGFFRYTGNRPPYKAPGGDAVAEVAVPVLKDFSK